MATMTASPRTWKDNVYLGWFLINIPVVLCVDLVSLYPSWLVVAPDAPLHFLWTFHEWYLRTYNDPIVGWTPADAGRSWVPLFMSAEAVFLLPTALYAAYRLAPGVSSRSAGGTTGSLELLLLVYSFHTALTTATCINDVFYWDPAVYSHQQKNMFVYQMFGPWFILPALMFVDMYSRLLQRFRAVDGAAKKTQ